MNVVDSVKMKVSWNYFAFSDINQLFCFGLQICTILGPLNKKMRQCSHFLNIKMELVRCYLAAFIYLFMYLSCTGVVN